MLTSAREYDGERVLTVQIDEMTIDAEVLSALASVLDDVEHGGTENFVVQFCGGSESVTGNFPYWPPSPVRTDIRYFARWDETLSRIFRLKTKTFAAYDGRVGAAAVHVGLVMDLRLASAHALLAFGSLADGSFLGMGAYWLPKFVGLGNARKIFLVGEDLPAGRASELGFVDVIEDTADAAVNATLRVTRRVTPEAACFSRRILDDCYLLEHSAVVELVKAARFKLGMSSHQHWPQHRP
jgi:enoyl-CoA hydratase/carnithine racemase